MSNKDFKKFANSKGVSSTVLHQFENSLTPYILEERTMNVTQMDIFSRMMKDRVLWVCSGINDEMASIIQAQLLYLSNIDPSSDIKMYINSPGGSVIAGNGICDTMDIVECDVATNCIGMAASMGAVILSNGTKGKRSSLISSRIMLHQASAGTQGHVRDMAINHRETEKHNFVLINKLAKNAGKEFNEVFNDINRDKWLNSDEAMSYGIIDEVVGIVGNNSITDQLIGFEEYYQMVNK